jgi:hypothetical protein
VSQSIVSNLFGKRSGSLVRGDRIRVDPPASDLRTRAVADPQPPVTQIATEGTPRVSAIVGIIVKVSTHTKRGFLRRVEPRHRPWTSVEDIDTRTYLLDRLAALSHTRRAVPGTEDDAVATIAQRERELRSWLPAE